MLWLKRLLLKLVLGKRTYYYMCRTVLTDPRLISARDVDMVIRKDGTERRIEADWIKKITKIIKCNSVVNYLKSPESWGVKRR